MSDSGICAQGAIVVLSVLIPFRHSCTAMSIADELTATLTCWSEPHCSVCDYRRRDHLDFAGEKLPKGKVPREKVERRRTRSAIKSSAVCLS